MTTTELLQRLQAMPPDLRVRLMVEIDGVQYEGECTDTGINVRYLKGVTQGPTYAILISEGRQ